MATVKLPSGKVAKVPDGLTELEVLELLASKLPPGRDKLHIANRQLKAKEGKDEQGTEDGVENTGITGAITGTLAGGVAALFTGGAAPLTAPVAAAVGSTVGNLAETVIGDYIAGRDPKVSEEEFKDILGRVGIDIVVGGAGAVVFKVASVTLSGILHAILSGLLQVVKGQKLSKGSFDIFRRLALNTPFHAGTRTLAQTNVPEEIVQGLGTDINRQFAGGRNKGGLIADKVSKIHGEGYTAPGQAMLSLSRWDMIVVGSFRALLLACLLPSWWFSRYT